MGTACNSFKKKKDDEGVPWRKLALSILYDTAVGMDFLHSRKLLHTDLKPENVVVDDQGRGLITDFGFAKSLYNRTDLEKTTGNRPGTKMYMSPQRLNHKACTKEDDVYSFAVMVVTLWKCESAILNFDDTDDVRKVLYGDFRPEVPKDLPEELGNLVRRCWHKEPSYRPDFAEIASVFRDAWCSFQDPEETTSANSVDPQPMRQLASSTPSEQFSTPPSSVSLARSDTSERYSQSPTSLQQRGGPAHIFIDNINVWKEARKQAPSLKGMNIGPDGLETLRVNYGALVDVVLEGRRLGEGFIIANGRGPPQSASFRKKFRDGVHMVPWQLKDERSINNLALTTATNLMQPESSEKGSIILISGDSRHKPLVERALELGWQAEVWFWSKTLSGELRNSGGTVRELDEHDWKFCFSEMPLPPSVKRIPPFLEIENSTFGLDEINKLSKELKLVPIHTKEVEGGNGRIVKWTLFYSSKPNLNRAVNILKSKWNIDCFASS
ncbi:kinase-like protein [Gonapodya prolifera JEL478]|uniref:Kinase-like protein n=1 Tax=Gonapodya prolifera (strain JEL478) TaxID=1344416 RepID=A0A139A0D4_GONPJ|nr:kinase-like protein [Gonapodya prolifera JEL478]|eukprot:KXS10221.1 kinase-like protein [Gonapodya prolifera JEL478]